MTLRATWFALFCAVTALGGCMMYWTAPLNAQVVNASTGRPLGGARVVAWPIDKKGLAKTFVTDDSGRVAIPSFEFFIPLPGDPGLSMPLTLYVDADGYVAVDLSSLDADLSLIQLTPITPSGDVP